MWSRHSWRAVLTHLSAKAFAFGVWVGVLMTRAPSLRSTSSNGRENLEVPDHEPDVPKPVLYRQVPGLLGDPGQVRVPGDAQDAHPGRDPSSMTNRTYRVRSHAVSIVKKSNARMA